MTKLQTLRTQIEAIPSRKDLLWAIECLEEAMYSLFALRSAAESKATKGEISDLIYKKLGHMLVKLGEGSPPIA